MAIGRLGKIGVLMGGPSSEREISLKSGKAVYLALRQAGLKVIPVDIVTDNAGENIKLLRAKKIDFAFLALHGRFGEDGSIQQILEGLKIPYTGSGVKASRLVIDKVAARRIFSSAGLAVPGYKVIEFNSRKNSANNFPLPLVVKPATQGSSIGLSIIDHAAHLKEAVDLAFRYDKTVLIEEYVSGRELTVGILQGRALPVIEIIPKKRFFDYQAKYQPGLAEYVAPAALDEKVAAEVKAAALSAHKLLGCRGCSRVDIILNQDNRPVVLEVNTIPGFTATSLLPKAAKITGIDFTALCLKLIELAYEKEKI